MRTLSLETAASHTPGSSETRFFLAPKKLPTTRKAHHGYEAKVWLIEIHLPEERMLSFTLTWQGINPGARQRRWKGDNEAPLGRHLSMVLTCLDKRDLPLPVMLMWNDKL